MSWRAPRSRPAPPVTSSSTSTLDQLFLGPSTSNSSASAPSLSLSSSNHSRSATSASGSSSSRAGDGQSAHALLSRKMSQYEGSVSPEGNGDPQIPRKSSSRSTLRGPTVSPEGNGRARAASSTSSIGTTTGRSVSPADSPRPEPVYSEPERDDDMMSIAESLDVKGKGKAKARDVPFASPSKRTRSDPERRPRTTSVASSSASIASRTPSQYASSTTPARLVAPRQPAAPVPSTSTSSDLSVSPSQGFLTAPKRWAAKPSSATSSVSRLGQNVGVTRSDSRRRAEDKTDEPKEPFVEAPSAPSPSDPQPETKDPQGLAGDDATTPKAESKPEDPLDSTCAQGSDAPTPTTQSGRGWWSMITGGRYGVTADGEPEDMTDQKAGDERRKEAGDGGEVAAEAAPADSNGSINDVQMEDSEEAKNDTLRGPAAPSEQYDTDTLTPRAVRPSRSSWWLWGSYADEAAQQPQDGERHAEEPPTTADGPEQTTPRPATSILEPDHNETAARDGGDTEMSSSPETTGSHVARSWIQTIWGESSEELAQRRKREAKAMKYAMNNSSLRIGPPAERKMIEDGPPHATDASASSSVASTSSFPVSSSSSSLVQSNPSDSTKTLRPKSSSSWAIFSRANPAVSASEASSPTKSSGRSLRAPLANLGLASSAASTRSRTSSHQTESNSHPPSPQLRPQPDGPVKPLTGSIRSGTQRQPRSLPPSAPDVAFENLVLPTFNDSFLRPPRSFPLKKSPLTRAVSVVSAYLFSHPPATSPPSQAQSNASLPQIPFELKDDPAEKLPKALEVVGEPSRLNNVKRVVTIGVHGWFPNARLKSVLGEPTGTSVKFATMMHDAVQSYLESHDVSSFNIQAIALEGEGQVEDRVNKLHSQLVERKEWVEALKKADVVFLATHSQGSVVSTQLLARMLDQGLITGTQTHLLAMCGIAQGPFVYLYQSVALAPYFNYLESAAARELFEFQDPESVVAIKFLESLRLILNAGIKVTVVGSINDQVVPLYSALFSGVTHPAILRAVYIDCDAFHTSDFLANLVVFSARLRNAGLSDHDLVYHVSEALAGALTGVGHSKIYEEEEVFNLAVRHQFETTSLVEAPTHLDTRAHAPALSMSFNPRDRRNPYLLTWALRGIIEDPHVRQLFGNELRALGEAYETWKPQTKVLKDCKLKLEGIRMINRTAGKL